MPKQFFIMLLFSICFLPQIATAQKYKIITHTTKTLPESEVIMQGLKKRLRQNSEFIKLQNSCTFHINCRESGKYCIVAIEPIGNKNILNKVFKIVKGLYKDAFINKYTAPIPIEHSIPIVNKKESTEPLKLNNSATDKQKITVNLPEPQISQYKTAIFLPLTLIVLSLLLFWFLRKKNRNTIHSHVDNNLLHINQNSKTSLLVDIQSHVIPGLDQDYGPDSIEEAVELIKELQSLGYKKIITTPTLSNKNISQNSELILNTLSTIRRELQENHIDMTIEVAALYKLDDNLIKSLGQKTISTFNKDYIIIEAPQNINYEIFKKYIIDIKNAGYKIILAHPENYTFLHNNLSKYQEIKKLDVLFELDINSLYHVHSNKEIKQHANLLIENGMVDFIGSNAHKLYHIHRIKSIKESDAYENIFKTNTILNNYLY